MRHFMVDIETLDTEPTAIVLSIGVVEFNKDGPVRVNDQIVSVEANLHTREQYARDRTMSLDTIEWWMDFGARYPKHNRRPPWQGLTEAFSIFPDDEDFIVWAKPPSFDLTILENLAEQEGVEVPWTRHNRRDVYTVADWLTKSERDAVKGKNLAQHNAVADCLEQIDLVVSAWNKRGYPF